jgi:hypothetical protein
MRRVGRRRVLLRIGGSGLPACDERGAIARAGGLHQINATACLASPYIRPFRRTAMLRFLGTTAGIIFLIGLLVVIGLLMLIF